MTSKLKIWICIIILALVSLSVYIGIKIREPGKYDDFAKCMSSKGIKAYGAYWCSNCQEQKILLGKSFRYINYIECTQKADECKNAEIKGYPTWIFPDGKRTEGARSLEELAALSGCSL